MIESQNIQLIDNPQNRTQAKALWQQSVFSFQLKSPYSSFPQPKITLRHRISDLSELGSILQVNQSGQERKVIALKVITYCTSHTEKQLFQSYSDSPWLNLVGYEILPGDSSASYLLLWGPCPGSWSSSPWKQLSIIVALPVIYKISFSADGTDRAVCMKVTDKQTGRQTKEHLSETGHSSLLFSIDYAQLLHSYCLPFQGTYLTMRKTMKGLCEI